MIPLSPYDRLKRPTSEANVEITTTVSNIKLKPRGFGAVGMSYKQDIVKKLKIEIIPSVATMMLCNVRIKISQYSHRSFLSLTSLMFVLNSRCATAIFVGPPK